MSARLRHVGPWATPFIAAAEIGLVWSGLLDWRLAVTLGVIIEAALWLTVATRAGVGIARYRHSRGAGADRWQAAEDGLAALVPRPLARFVLLEPRLWVCLFRWLSGHHEDQREDTFAYHRQIGQLLAVGIALVVIEGAVVDTVLALVVPGTPWAWVVLGVHVYGLVILAGMYASFVTRPHLVGDDRIVLRDGVFCEVLIPRDALVNARVERRANLGRSGYKQSTGAKPAILAVGDATVLLTFDPSFALYDDRLAARAPSQLAITVNDAHGFVRALRQDRAFDAPARLFPEHPSAASARRRTGRAEDCGGRRYSHSTPIVVPPPDRHWRGSPIGGTR